MIHLLKIILVACLPLYLFCEVAMTYEEAMAKVLDFSPHLKIAEEEVGEKLGLRRQSAVFPNPTFSYSVENVYGNKNWKGWESAESRYEFGQLVELGGKRSIRRKSADFQLYAQQADYEAQTLFVFNQLRKAFVTVAAAQELLKLAKEQTRIANEAFKTVAAKVEAGKVSLIQKNKAEIALSSAQINEQKVSIDFRNAKERLVNLWGESSAHFDKVQFPFFELNTPLTMQDCLAKVMKNPELLKLYYEQQKAHQDLNYEKALSIPDITFLVGYKTLQDTKNKGMILGAALPLPVYNRNQGNIQKARHTTYKLEDQYYQLITQLERQLTIAHNDLQRAYQEASLMEATVLKTAIQSFEFAQEGYKEGKFEYLDMLDSQRTLFEVRERYIQALLNYHKSNADIEYLTSQVLL